MEHANDIGWSIGIGCVLFVFILMISAGIYAELDKLSPTETPEVCSPPFDVRVYDTDDTLNICMTEALRECLQEVEFNG